MLNHDGDYRLFFSDPRLIVQLLQGFVKEPWVKDLDPHTIERLNATFHNNDGEPRVTERREADMIWRIPLPQGENAWLLLLLEHQSTPEPLMALRCLNYTVWLWGHLIRENKLSPNGKLAPIFSLVLYSGERPWKAPQSLRDLIDLPADSPLWRWQPEMCYYFIDQNAYAPEVLAEIDSLTAYWLQTNQAQQADQYMAAVQAIIDWIGRHQEYEDAARTIAGLLKTRARKHGCEKLVPDDLREVKVMFETVIENVKLAAHQEGMQKGIQAGIQEGIQAGIQKGIQEGIHRGEVAVLLRLLEHRFGAVAVPDEMRERIAAAEPALLEDWTLRVLDASLLNDVFGDASPSVH